MRQMHRAAFREHARRGKLAWTQAVAPTLLVEHPELRALPYAGEPA